MSEQVGDILEFDGDTCVRASAGTGKTFMLVEKYLHSLKRKDENGRFFGLENILAITFTEKAAEEMRARIVARIAEESQALLTDRDERKKVKIARHLVACRRRISQAFISTIHSFCARVLRENPVEAGIDPHYEILDEQRSAVLQAKSLERFLLWKLRNRDRIVLDLAYRYGFDSDFRYESSLLKIINSLLPLVRASGTEKAGLLAEYERQLVGVGKKLKGFKKESETALCSLEGFAKTDLQKKQTEIIKAGLPGLSPKKNEGSLNGIKRAEGLLVQAKKFRFPKNDMAKEAVEKLQGSLEEYGKLMVSSLAVTSAKQVSILLNEFHDYMENEVKGRDRLDFDDLQERVLLLFRRNDAVRHHYRGLFRQVLVDEFQDLNGIQKKILDQLAPAGEGRLFIVGDAKQAIYGFRGGDSSIFDEAQKEIKDAGGKTFYLKKNRRSSEQLVEFANRLFGECHGEIFKKEDICQALRGPCELPPVERLTFDGPELPVDDCRFREAGLIASRIMEMVTEEKVPVEDNGRKRAAGFGDIAILFRKFTSLPLYEAALNNAGIRYVIHKGAGFFQSQEVADLISVLLYLEDPGDLVSFVGALRSPYAGCSDETILKLRRGPSGKLIDTKVYLENPETPPDVSDSLEVEKFAEFIAWVNSLRKMKDRMTVSETIEAVLEKSRITGILGAQTGGLQKVANILKLIEMARMMEQESTVTLKNFVRRLSELFDQEAREPYAPVASEDDYAVKVMTIHQSKGLEFNIVFLADVDSGVRGFSANVIFNPHKGIAAKYIDKGTLKSRDGKVFGEIKRLNNEKEKREEARLFYVACTRAKDRLVISGNTMKRQVSSGFAGQADLMMERHPELFHAPARSVQPPAIKGPERSVYDALVKEGGEYEAVGKRPARDFERVLEKGPVDARRLFFPVSSLTTYVRCPREYLFRRFYKITPEKGKGHTLSGISGGRPGVLEMGEAVHSILQSLDFEDGIKDFRKSAAMNLKTRLPELDEKSGKKIVRELEQLYGTRLFRQLREGKLKEVGREIPFTAKLGSNGGAFFVNGKMDLLLKDRELGATVVDFKYSTGSADDAADRFQLDLYALVTVGQLSVEKVGCALLYLKGSRPKTVEWELDTNAINELEKKTERVIEKMIELEEKARSVHGRLPFEGDRLGMPDVECKNPQCPFAGFCLS